MHSPAGNTTQLVLGFPIRTSSDQRTVGNSPRLNAASHVLHRPSMPRHPPYARNTKQQLRSLQKLQTTQQTKITQKEQDARVHYTVLTQHTPHEDQPPQQMINQQWNATKRNTQCCPRHPTACQHTKNFCRCTNVLSVMAQRAHPTTTPHTHISMKTMVGCVSTRTFTNISVAAPHSGTQPPHPQLWAINKSSLERR